MSTGAIAHTAPLLESEKVRSAGISSPPDSNNAMKLDGTDSELSDIEEPEEDVGEILPKRYEDGVPVFTPTMEQFKDFTCFMNKINHFGMKSGIVKVIPPEEWKDNMPALDEAIKTIRVKDPIAQEITGTGGTYRQLNIQHQRSYNLVQWRQLCDQSEHQPPAKRGERRANQDNNTRSGQRTRGASTAGTSGARRRGPGRPSKKAVNVESTTPTDETSTNTPDRLPTPVSPPVKAEDDMESVKNEPDLERKPTAKSGRGGRQAPAIASVSSRRKYNRREAAGLIDEAAFKDFEYRLLGEEYTKDRCEELERAYWKTLTYAPPLYGADMPGSLFPESVESWNLGKLDNLLDILGTKIPGVNTAYLYLGMWKATFAWHLEDVDLYSINYNHFGAPKQWYSISQKDARRFEAAMKSIWPADAKACDQFLRHKTFLISPTTLLEKYNVKVNKVVHRPGEFVITFPYGYHSGFNMGYNAAEAVNFAMESWLELGRVAKKCDCDQAQDSVWIDEHDMRKLRGEETEFEESDEEEDDDDGPNDLPTPPGSSGEVKVKRPRLKRKRPVAAKQSQHGAKRIRMFVRYPCVLCPNDIPSQELLPTDCGNKAHRICAQYIPETDIEPGTVEMITGTGSIPKARKELRCGFCKNKKGAAFQCSQKKCTRAFHATCAAAAGVHVEEGERPVFGPDGTEYKEHAFEFSCRFHRVKRDKKYEADALEEDARIRTAASKMAVGSTCQFQYYRGDIFAGIVVENRRSEEMFLVDILPRGERIEVGYKWLLVHDPADNRLPKPSANAIPLPKDPKKSLVTSKRQANDLPRKEDPFLPGFTWEEFNTFKLERNVAQVKVDLSKENQIWYYLGKHSTDAKAQFTEDPAKPKHNPKGHFLDTIPKPAPVSRQSYTASYPASYPAPYPSSVINQHALNAVRASNRPVLPPNPSRPSNKPYEYKPRSNSESYRVDSQAFRSQQTFLQNSVMPYAFDSDPNYKSGPRWSPTEERKPVPFPTYHPPVPPVSTSLSRMGPPSASMSRPSSSSHTSTKPNNPFSNPFSNGNSGRSSSAGRSSVNRSNPFAKYPYLQKQHNRSPLDYKSPYAPGGGFMHGYEGDLKEHLRRNPEALFQTRRGSQSSPLTPNPLRPTYSSSHTQNYLPSLPYSYSPQSTAATTAQRPPAVKKFNPATYASMYGRSPSQAAQNNSSVATTNIWEKKNSAGLHPAIRQEYGSMFHNQYQPPQTNQGTSSSPGVQSPSHQPPGAPPHQSSTPPQPLYQPQINHNGPKSQPQLPQAPPAPMALPHPNQSQPPQQNETRQPLYAHQQYFQNSQHHTQPPVPQQSHSPLVPDVPADSTSLVEKLMANLRQASRKA